MVGGRRPVRRNRRCIVGADIIQTAGHAYTARRGHSFTSGRRCHDDIATASHADSRGRARHASTDDGVDESACRDAYRGNRRKEPLDTASAAAAR